MISSRHMVPCQGDFPDTAAKCKSFSWSSKPIPSLVIFQNVKMSRSLVYIFVGNADTNGINTGCPPSVIETLKPRFDLTFDTSPRSIPQRKITCPAIPAVCLFALPRTSPPCRSLGSLRFLLYILQTCMHTYIQGSYDKVRKNKVSEKSFVGSNLSLWNQIHKLVRVQRSVAHYDTAQAAPPSSCSASLTRSLPCVCDMCRG